MNKSQIRNKIIKIRKKKFDKDLKIDLGKFISFLKINKFGIPEPVQTEIIYPDILLVPLVAYDSSLNRLGYGGGYYDRYIEKIEKIKKVTKIGLAFSFQKISSIPSKS